jgi:putative zinc finger protein
MTCNECFEAFSCALDNELEPELQDAMQSHLESCADCRHLQSRMLSLSMEIKGQPFPAPSEKAIKSMAQTALSESATVSWDWLRRLLRFPYEHWVPRTGIRLVTYGFMLLLVLQTIIVRFIQPLYSGVEAVSNQGLEGLSTWSQWAPPIDLVHWWALGVFLFGAWTAGMPGFLVDLWSGTRLSTKDLLTIGVGMVLVGPVMFLPYLAHFQAGRYTVACCIWAGFCSLCTYATMVFKTRRPLPRLATDFVVLIIVLGGLEVAARTAMQFDGPGRLNTFVRTAVGHFGFAGMVTGLGLVGLTLVLTVLGLTGLLRSYRSQGGRLIAGLLLIAAATSAVRIPFSFSQQALSLRPEPNQRAYILGSVRDNPWVLSQQAYPGIEASADNGTPEAARANLIAAYLHWNEAGLLSSLSDWAEHAPGVTWGMVGFVESLGERDGNVLSVPTEERRKTVSQLLQKLRWRRLNDVVLSSDSGVITGTIIGWDGKPAQNLVLRLIPVKDNGTIQEVLARLSLEQEWAEKLLQQTVVDPNSSVPRRNSVITDANGRFRFPHLQNGRYFLAILLDREVSLTLNSSIPGAIDLEAGKRLELGEIQLSVGREGDDVSLASERWQTTGEVSFSNNSEADSAKLEDRATITGFVDTKLFAGGRARVKVASLGLGTLKARFFTKEGDLVESLAVELSESGFDELDIDTKGKEGYLQLILSSGVSGLTVENLKVEVLSRG